VAVDVAWLVASGDDEWDAVDCVEVKIVGVLCEEKDVLNDSEGNLYMNM